jgi:hypothetical protein
MASRMHDVAAYYTAAAALTGFFSFDLNMRAFLLVRCHCRERSKGVFGFRAQNGREGTGMGTQRRGKEKRRFPLERD